MQLSPQRLTCLSPNLTSLESAEISALREASKCGGESRSGEAEEDLCLAGC